MAQEFESSQEQRVLPQSDKGMSAFFQLLASKIPSSPHPVSRERGVYTTNPQVNPDIMCLKSSTPQSLTSTSTIAGSTAKPLSTAAQVRVSQQPDVATLASYGIKVRDFAYESTLPPVKPVHLLPRQIQPGLRALKRVRGGEDILSQPIAGSAADGEGSFSKKSKLERTVTEPALESGVPPTRERGFVNLDDYDLTADSQAVIDSQQSDPPTSQPPVLYFESQDSEPYIDTPFVTPNGSLQWPVTDNSTIPASQLDTASQEAAPEPLSYSQLGFSQADQPSQQQVSRGSSSVLSDPPTSPISLLLDHLPGPSTRTTVSPSPLRFPATTLSRCSNPSPESHSPTTSPIPPASRYYLRKRVTVKSPPSLMKSATHTRRAVPPPKHLTTRPLACSIQSSHSRAKSHNANGSPKSRTIRTRTATRNTSNDGILVR